VNQIEKTCVTKSEQPSNFGLDTYRILKPFRDENETLWNALQLVKQREFSQHKKERGMTSLP